MTISIIFSNCKKCRTCLFWSLQNYGLGEWGHLWTDIGSMTIWQKLRIEDLKENNVDWSMKPFHNKIKIDISTHFLFHKFYVHELNLPCSKLFIGYEKINFISAHYFSYTSDDWHISIIQNENGLIKSNNGIS